MPITHYDVSGLTLYVRLDDASDTAVAMTAGSGTDADRYVVTDAELVTAGLAAGTYTGRVREGNVASQAITDAVRGTIDDFRWDGSSENVGGLSQQEVANAMTLTPSGEAQSLFAKAGATSTISPDEISKHRTWFGGIEGHKFQNIVTVNTFSVTTTFSADFADEALNPGTVIQSAGTITVTRDSDSSSVTTSNLALRKDQTAVNFEVAAIATAGDHTVSVSVVTTDGETITKTGKLKVV